MIRFAGLVAVVAGCTKAPPSNQEPTSAKLGNELAPSERGGAQVRSVGEGVTGGAKGGDFGGPPEGLAPGSNKADEARFRLQPAEGKLAVESPAAAKANSEVLAKVTVTAGDAYKVNTEFPTKLTLETTDGVTVAKAELHAGGPDKLKGDAEVFDEHHAVFSIKLTPTTAGTRTVNGLFKFAVCDKAGSTCLAKKERIAIQLAAN